MVRTPGNNEKYLRKGFDGAYSEGGTLFLDERCDPAKPTANLMIYGHDMSDGSMFGELEAYASETYGAAHPVICFDTLTQPGQYRLLAAFTARCITAPTSASNITSSSTPQTRPGSAAMYPA